MISLASGKYNLSVTYLFKIVHRRTWHHVN